jgi:anti-sigma B factor antagonist
MDATVSSYGSAEVVHMPEKLTMENASSIEKALTAMEKAGKNRLVLDMTGVGFIDSSGLAVLVAAYKRVKKDNGRAVLLSPQPSVQSLLELTRLHKLFEIFQDANTAIKRVNEA